MEKSENNTEKSDLYNSKERHELDLAKKEGIRKGAVMVAVIFMIIAIFTGIVAHSSFRTKLNAQLLKMSEQRKLFADELNSRDSTINDWLMTFDQIEKDLNSIKEKESVITLKSSQQELSNDRKSQVLDDIKYINTVLENNKKKISSLNTKVKNSNTSVKVLNKKIALLESSVKQYEDAVADLKKELVKKNFEINELNNRMTAQEFTIKEQTEKINDQEQKINQAFLISGTLKDLKKKGIVYQDGGFLGIGKREHLSTAFSDREFQMVNVEDTKSIPVNSREVKLITYHPESSYRMIKEKDEMIASIEIKNPDEFWKISKYAVVQVGK